jgi:glyoxylase-like metal-dependent hydrolase (beta-lactamase superfamily II)
MRLYVDAGERKLVVDTGIGDKFNEKQNTIYGVENFAGGLRQVMANRGLDYRAVTDVILTHLHFDHAGGATVATPGGGFEPTFPNATYHLQRRAHAWAEQPTEKDRASFRRDDWAALDRAGRLRLIDGAEELLPGVSLIQSEGHTVGLQLVLIDGGNDGRLLFCSDLIPTSAHLALPYIMSYDLYPLTTLEEKRLLLARALGENWTLFFEHDPKIAAARVAEDNGKLVLGETLSF